VAGVLFASLVDFIEPAPFAVGASIMMYLMVVVGGSGYFWGPLVGAAMGVVVPDWIRDAAPILSNWYLPLFGMVVVLMMIWLPDGLLSLPDRLKEKRDSRKASLDRAKRAADMGAVESSTAQTGAKP
jgi:branched-chain amino acid transport system permease protein